MNTIIQIPNYFPELINQNINPKALQMLNAARHEAQIPFTITSTHRTPEHSVEVGGLKNDAHTESPCSAFDINCNDSISRFKIVRACLLAGFRRVGLNAKHVHVDVSSALPDGVFWLE